MATQTKDRVEVKDRMPPNADAHDKLIVVRNTLLANAMAIATFVKDNRGLDTSTASHIGLTFVETAEIVNEIHDELFGTSHDESAVA